MPTPTLAPKTQGANWKQFCGYHLSTPLGYVALSLVTSLIVATLVVFVFNTVGEILGFEGWKCGTKSFMSITLISSFLFIGKHIIVPEADEILVLQNPFGINYPVKLEGFDIPEIEDEDPRKVMAYTGPAIVVDGAFMPVEVTVKPPWVTIATRFKVGPRVLVLKDQFPLKPAPLPGSGSTTLVQRTVSAEFSLQYQVVRLLAGITAKRFFSGECKGYVDLEEQVRLHVLNYMRQWFAQKTPDDIQGGTGQADALAHLELCYGEKAVLDPKQIELGITLGKFKIVSLALTTASEDEAVERRLTEQRRSLANAAADVATRRNDLVNTMRAANCTQQQIADAVRAFDLNPAGVNMNQGTP